MTTSTKLREIRDGGEAEYQLNPPITITIFGETREIAHVISSHAYAMRAGIMEDETMIFQSDGNGNIVRYGVLHIVSQVDLYYMPGHVDHDEELAIITRKAYRAAKAGRGTCVHHASNLNFLKEVARYLEDLGYTTEILRQPILGPTIIIRWDNKETEPTPTDYHNS